MRALDLFCGGGGTCIGLMQAGFEVVGIDIKKPRDYPGTFIQADALNPPVDLTDFDFVWASPPCQLFSPATNSRGQVHKMKHKDFIPETRALLEPHPYTCIENVPSAPIRHDLVLTGPCVGLHKIRRKRAFEMSFYMLAPPPASDNFRNCLTITTSMSCSNHYWRRVAQGLPGRVPVPLAKEVMGIPPEHNLTGHEVGESVPPPYAKFIADHVMTLLC